MAYPPVHISNSTPYNAGGEVTYDSAFCSKDEYQLTPAPNSWTASSRGACLVNKITCTVYTPTARYEATPYTSSGTSYSQFALVQTDDGGFQITRLDH